MSATPQHDPDSEPVLVESALSQRVTRNGHSVEVRIYGTVPHEWTLEIVDAVKSSHVWTEPFATAQAALDEALKTIDEEGIEAFMRPDFERP